jgi:hypothetical protein
MTTKSTNTEVKPTVKTASPVVRDTNGKLIASPELIAHAAKHWEDC